MKKILYSAAAMMLAFSFSAFAGTPKNKDEAKQPTVPTSSSSGQLHWFKKTGPTTYVYQGSTSTKEEQELNTGCDGTSVECQRAFDDTQVNSSSNPAAGIKPGQENSPIERIYNQD